MYEEFFGLQRRPFSPTPDANCFVACEGMQGALDALAINCERGQGIGVLTAEAGLGKSLLGLRLAMELQPTFATAFLGHSAYATRRALLQAVLFELHRPYNRMAEQELRLELTAALRDLRTDKTGFVLIIDEAHRLSEPLLDEVRLLTLPSESGEPLSRIVLIGNRDLEERLADPAMAAFNQRVACQVDLTPLTQAESIEYLRTQVEWAEGQIGEVFTDEALAFIAKAADGIPRCLNHLADHALLLAFVLEQRPVALENVRTALDDLKQLPLQWNDPLTGGEIYRGLSNSPSMEDSAVELWPNPVTNETKQPRESADWDHPAFGSLGAAIEIGGELQNSECESTEDASDETNAEPLTCLKDDWHAIPRQSLSVDDFLADVAELTDALNDFSNSDEPLPDLKRESSTLGQIFGSRQFEFGAPTSDSFEVEEFATDEIPAEEIHSETHSDAEDWSSQEQCDEESAIPVWNLPSTKSANTWTSDEDSEFEEERVIDRYIHLEAGHSNSLTGSRLAPHHRAATQRVAAQLTGLVMSGSSGQHDRQDSEVTTNSVSEDAGIVEQYSKQRFVASKFDRPLKTQAAPIVVNHLADADEFSKDSVEIKPPAERHLPTDLLQATYEDDGPEEQLGADVLDLYLEVQQSLFDLKAASLTGRKSVPLPVSNETNTKESVVERQPDSSEPINEAQPGTIQRAYGRLFSELRRRKR